MQIAASTRCYGGESMQDCFTRLVDHGFRKVELCLGKENCVMDPSVIKDDPERASLLYAETTRLTPIALDIVDDVDVPTFKAMVEFARLLKLTQISVPSSQVGTPFNTEIDKLRELAKIASEGGVRVSIKTHRGCLTEDPHTAVELCQSVKGLGITLDPSHYICSPRGVQEYDIVYPYVYHCHFRDTLPDQLQVQAGLGQVDYSRCISMLKQNEFDSGISVDLLPGTVEEGFEYPLEMRKLRMLLESLL